MQQWAVVCPVALAALRVCPNASAGVRVTRMRRAFGVSASNNVPVNGEGVMALRTFNRRYVVVRLAGGAFFWVLREERRVGGT